MEKSSEAAASVRLDQSLTADSEGLLGNKVSSSRMHWSW